VLDVPDGDRLVVSTDASVDRVHFRHHWLRPHEIGYRSVAAALSDLAAMAALPLGVVISLVLPDTWIGDLPELADGMADCVRECGTRIVGGDISRGVQLVIGVTVLGSTGRPIGRDTAKPGDTIYVTGVLGGPGLALDAWMRERAPDPMARARFAYPRPRLREAKWLAGQGMRATIDISDGLVGDLGHIASASGATAIVDLDAVPVLEGTTAIDAVQSGEEYELLFTAARPIDAAAFSKEFGLPVTAIGRIEKGEATVVLEQAGKRVASPGGYDHFS
jgi:thiamine-monophosphate kinase